MWERALGKLRRFAEREWADPAWFLPPEAVAERVWKAPPASSQPPLHNTLPAPRRCVHAPCVLG